MDKETNAQAEAVERGVRASPRARWMGTVECVLRLLAVGATLAAAIVMARDKQTILVFGASIAAKYSHSPAFVFFVVANAVACAYAFVSASISLLKHKCSAAIKFVIFLLDLVMVGLVMAGASAATAVAYIGQKGNSHAQWSPICKVFDRFCDHVGGALLSSYIGLIIFMLLTILSTLSLYKHTHTH